MTGRTSGTAPTLSFVVPVRNGAAHLGQCLSRLNLQRDSEIIVVDNESTDDSRAIASRLGARVIDGPGLRVGACRNAGAAVAQGQVLAFVDADNEVDDGWGEACLHALRQPGVGLAGYPYRAPDQPTWVQRIYDTLRARPPGVTDTDWLGAGNMAVRREVFDLAGGFDESLETCEDVAFCRAVHQAGYRVANVAGMGTVHHGDPATLPALFRGELWRGRDNLRVSLRGPVSARDLPSILSPIATLILLTAGVIALAAWTWSGGSLLWLSAIGLAAVIGGRTLVLVMRGRLLTPLQWARALAVAATYETARALSLVAGATHRTRTRVPRHA